MLTRAEIKTNAKQALEGKWGKGALITLAYMAFFFVVGFLIGLIQFIPILGQLASLANSIIQIPLALGLTFAFIKLKRGEEVKPFDFLELGFTNFKKAWAIVGRTLLKMIVPIIIMGVLLIGMIFFSVISIGSLVGSSYLQSSDYSYDDFDLNAFRDGYLFDDRYSLDDISYNPYARSSSYYGSSSSSIQPRDLNSDMTAGLVGVGVGSILIAGVIALAYFGVSIWATCKGLYYALAQFIAFDNPDMTAKDIVQKSEDLMKGNRAKLFVLNLSFIGWAILACFTLGIGMLWLMPYMIVSLVCFYEVLAGKNDKNVAQTVPAPTQDNEGTNN